MNDERISKKAAVNAEKLSSLLKQAEEKNNRVLDTLKERMNFEL
jgi:hypothetical protein